MDNNNGQSTSSYIEKEHKLQRHMMRRYKCRLLGSDQMVVRQKLKHVIACASIM
jgi:hypothetical protein